MWKKRIITIIFLAIIMLTAACTANTSTLPSDPSVPPTDTTPPATEPVFEEQVLVDNFRCTVKIIGYDASMESGYTLHIYAKNKTKDDVFVSFLNPSINDVMCYYDDSPYWDILVPAQSGIYKSLRFAPSVLTDNNITTVSQIAFELDVAYVYLNASSFFHELRYFYPSESEAAESIPRPAEDSDTVLFDSSPFKMRITGYEPDAPQGYTINVYMENTGSLEMFVNITAAYVNGYYCDPQFHYKLRPFTKSTAQICFAKADLEQLNITNVTDIALEFELTNPPYTHPFQKEYFQLYPQGEVAAAPYARPQLDDAVLLFDNEYCAMFVTGLDPDGLFGYHANVYLENKTDTTLVFYLNDPALNGSVCDPDWRAKIAPGKRSLTRIIWTDALLEENQITAVSAIELPVHVYDLSGAIPGDLVNATYEITPS